MRRTAVLALVAALLLTVPSGQALASPQAPLAPVHHLDAGAAARAAAAPELDATDRWIVVLKPGEDAGRAEGRARGLGANPDHTFSHAVHGYAAKLDGRQLDSVRRDPAVAMVVADDVFSMQSQSVPTGVERVFGLRSPITTIDGVDDRVDADVAIVDTGIDRTHPDLNVVGGVNCSTSDRNAWWDSNGHGTHVAGTVGALDNGFGVVGVAPGVRLWAVRILDSAGNGLLSWYVCGLDWITAQRDPQDPARPLFEAVNMSVAKPGSDDHACGATNGDILHAAICRLVASGVTVVAAAGNNSFNASRLIPASYDEVITVSALADTDGSPGGAGGNACLSWGGYDKDDTFADFSNYGADVDLIAPGKCILSTLPGNRYGVLSGTSMAAPLVTGAVALYKSSRPLATPDQVKAALEAMGNLDWNTTTDRDPYHEPLLDVSKIVAAGDYSLNAAASQGWVQAIDGTVVVPLTVNRAEDFVAPVDLTLTPPIQLAGFTEPTAQLTGAFDPPTLTGLDATSSALTVTVPPGTPPGTYPVVVHATSGGLDHTVQLNVTVGADLLVTRLAGASRFDTAAAISAHTFSPGVGVAYIATAYNFPDALAGAAAAGTIKGPVLLVAPTGAINPATTTELTRLKPARIIVLGATGVVSEAVFNALKPFATGNNVVRYAGASRFDTAAAISAHTFSPGVGVAYIATAYNFPDALAGAAAAGTVKGPVLLVAPTGAINPATATELTRLHPGRIIVLGGTGVVSEAVKTALGTYTTGTVTRLAGTSRFDTAAAISAHTFSPGVGVAYIATAFNFPDALAGAAAAGTLKGPVLLVAPTGAINPATTTELTRLKPARIIVLGSTGVVSEAVRAALVRYATGP